MTEKQTKGAAKYKYIADAPSVFERTLNSASEGGYEVVAYAVDASGLPSAILALRPPEPGRD